MELIHEHPATLAEKIAHMAGFEKHPFKGNVDLDKVQALIDRVGAANIAVESVSVLWSTSGSSTAAGSVMPKNASSCPGKKRKKKPTNAAPIKPNRAAV